MSTLQGKVKWFNGKKGYGFIERDDKEKDAFVHASAVKAAGMRFLNEGDKLEFTLEDGPKGPSAVNLKKIDQFLNISKGVKSINRLTSFLFFTLNNDNYCLKDCP